MNIIVPSRKVSFSPSCNLFPEIPYERAKRVSVPRPPKRAPFASYLPFPEYAAEEALANDAIERCAARLAENERKAEQSTQFREIVDGATTWNIRRDGRMLTTASLVEGEETKRVEIVYASLAEASTAFNKTCAAIVAARRSTACPTNAGGRRHKINADGAGVVRSEKEAIKLFNEVRSKIEAMIAKNRLALSADFVDHAEIASISRIAGLNACLRWKKGGDAKLETYVCASIQLRIAEAVTEAKEKRKIVRFVSVDEMTDEDGESLGYEKYGDTRWTPGCGAFWSRACVGSPGWTSRKQPLFARIADAIRRFLGGGQAASV